MKTPKLESLFREVRANKKKIEKGLVDPFGLAAQLSEKYFSKIDPKWGKRKSNEEDPYTDLIFAVFDILEVDY